MTTQLRGVAEFEEGFRSWAAKQPRTAVHRAVRYIGLEGIRRLVLRSPVAQGRYRANHRVTIGGPTTAEIETEDPSGAATIAAGEAVLATIRDDAPFEPIHMGNAARHAEALEYGHSSQAPQGVYGVTFNELTVLVVPQAEREARR